jgi:ATP/maltotriose-dependent transcriptional regulator MalT/DNA-binding SARP family transcriptional activator
MVTYPLVKSKLTAPELPQRMLHSQRLKGFPIEDRRITVITAQAGFGKTTTVLLALEKKDLRWYRMEKEDSFLPVFYAHLIETMFRDMDQTRLDCHRALTGVQDLADEYPIVNAQICQDAAELETEGSRIYLVLDDFHNVSENKAIVESIRYFAVNLPEFVSIVVTSRTETDILSGKLSLSRDSLSITESSLRFTREETGKLITSIYKLKISEGEMDRIYERSEGWIAGISMLCHNSLSAGSEFQDSNEGIFRRYFREFFYQLDQKRQDVLADLSILPDFSAEEIREVFRYEQAEELLKWLETSNLYIQKLPMETARFRFHSLFQQSLSEILLERIDSEQLNRRCRKAAEYYCSKGNKELAIRLLLDAGQTDPAADIAIKECIRQFDKGHLENMGDYVNGFPESVILQDPYLLFFKSITYQNVSHAICLDYAMKSLRTFLQRRDTSYLMNTFGMILVITFQTNSFAMLREASGLLPVPRILFGGRGPLTKLLVSMASGMVAEEKFAVAARMYRILDRLRIGDPVWNNSSNMIRGILLYRTGKLEQSKKNFRSVLEHPVGMSSDRWKITGLVAGHLALNLMRDMDGAKAAMAELSALAEEYDSSFARGFSHRMAAFISYQTNDMANALENIEKSAEAFDRSASPTLASVSRITNYFWSSSGDAGKMAELALAELEHMQNYEIGHGFDELCRAMIGGILIYAGQYDEAERFLTSAVKTSEKKGALQSVCGALAQMVNLYYCTGNTGQLRISLRRWAKLTSENDFIYFWEADHRTFVRACAAACKYGFDRNHMAKAIEKNYGKEAAARILRDPATIEEWPDRLFDEGKPHREKPKIDIKLLGRFLIAAGETAITDEDFKTRKISGILKYILLHNGKAVSRDALTGVFWPESDEKSAFASLRVALSDLRKVLARCDLSFDGDNALLCENKSGFYISGNHELRFDTDAFTDLYRIYNGSDCGDAQKIALLEEILSIYDGDLLEENLYDDWVMAQRENYHSIFIEASHALAQVYFSNRKFDEAERVLSRHLVLEPLDEKACSMLLQVFQGTDQENRAEAFRRQFERRFFEEMGQRPVIYVCPAGI